MSSPNDFKIENFEEYFGDILRVKSIIDNCEICGSKLIFAHLSDYKNLLIQETAHCPECGNKGRRKLHVLN
jgi:hypothetical protein